MLKSVINAVMLAAAVFMYNNGAAQTPARVQVSLNKVKAPMKPVWACFGYDEPNYTYMKDGKKLLTEISQLSPVPVYVRTHSLLVSGDGEAALKWGSTNAYTEDAQGNPVYNWRLVDSIFDTYVKRGMKPFAQIGFMPQALSTHPDPYRHHWKPGAPYTDIITGWAYPPKDYKKWGDLAYNWVKHCIERYGKKEVESWYWEVWNEPNGHYWKGTQQEFFKLYDYAADGVKRALPTAKIGGINIAGTSGRGAQQWTNAFIKHCLTDTNYATGKIGSPLDLLAFHAKGNPKLVNGIVQMNMSPQLRDIATGFKIAATYPQTKSIPLIVGESDPEGCAACGMATNPSNAYRNGTMYSSYAAATFARKYELEDQYNINFKGAVSWSFEFENQPWFYGFRDLATNGVDKPVLNVFRMFGKMGGNRVEAVSDRMYALKIVMDSSVRGKQSDIGVLASKNAKSAAVMVWNYHDDDKQGPAEPVQVTVNDVPSKLVTLTHYRIDDKHSNSYEVWKKMGSPQQPTAAQITQLQRAGQLATFVSPKKVKVGSDNKLSVDFELPRQGVSLLKIDW
ncbi:GH39 family glycosyl hydrolase [Mucilaginibacter aquatilis]|uniref:Beta-xylosidase n=1 Tax=Mucilaginibacter aquatilis TaxID=1517760 RepID=A0A6I4ICN7_9SPHI|nr:beta-xylosidase [Mucilaginibacter aquatilis]MVN91356.1 beta-xylosidase [Mucilaginibacter aquatilis]